MKFTKEKMDLFELDNSWTFAHCIATDGKMGAGIARQFRDKHPIQTTKIDQFSKNKQLNIGMAAYLKEEPKEHATFYLITKASSYKKPFRKDFNTALLELRRKCETLGIKKLAMPKIGAGLDRLDWDTSEQTIKDLFNDLDIEIKICIHYKKP